MLSAEDGNCKDVELGISKKNNEQIPYRQLVDKDIIRLGENGLIIVLQKEGVAKNPHCMLE